MSNSKLKIADPVQFAETVFGAELWSIQKDILRAIETNRRVAVKSGHASGKAYAAALAALWFAARYEDARVLVIAPGWLLVKSVFWSEVHGLLRRTRYRLPFTKVNETQLSFGPRNLILGLSTSDSGRLQGHHSARLLVIVDEAPALDPAFWPAIEGVLASGDSRLLMLGNPTTTAGPFYDAFGRNRAAWNTFSISSFDTPNFEGVDLSRLLAMKDAELDDNERGYLVTRRWVRERYDEWFNGDVSNSPLWASRVLGEFPSSSSDALIPLAWLEAARRPAVDDLRGDIVIGVDCAGPGKDRTVAIACCGSSIIETMITTASDARGPVIQFLRKWSSRLRIARIDSSGIGWYLLQAARDENCRCEGLNAGSSPKDKDRFVNVKAERFWYLREAFQKVQVSGLSDDMLAELAAINYLIAPNGKTQIEDKSSVKSALGKSPDLAEALMLALGEPAYEPFVFTPVPPPTSGYAYTGRRLSQWEKDAADDARALAERRAGGSWGGFRRLRKSRRWDGGTW